MDKPHKLSFDLTPVEVVWHDAHEVPGTWIEVAEIDIEPCVVKTYGIIIPNAKKDHTVIAGSYTSEGMLSDVTAIPNGMVISVKPQNKKRRE